MDRIYQEAIVTIIAASGTDAHSGLPGVIPTSRNTQRLVKEIVPGLHMTTIQDLDFWLRPSKYSQRGWTMQEEVLSRRKLIFINNQVYFRCLEIGDASTISEELNHPGEAAGGL
ncbi:hypothetical protein N0V90_007888 [Kalmusia sp. IMI 367209]|nr:hypothetical protein N0V90_007888 [Kalmusia sp. IMI 367209]